MYYYIGQGLVNSAINNLPFEMHIPGYNWCGPGTALQKRLEREDVGINELDEACKEHDIFYSKNNDVKQRHLADNILKDKAYKRVFAKNASFGEKLAALAVTGAMKAKVKLGMGITYNRKQQIIKKQIKIIEKLKKSIDESLLNLKTTITTTTTTTPMSNIPKKKQIYRTRKRSQKINVDDNNMMDTSEYYDTDKIKKYNQKRKLEETTTTTTTTTTTPTSSSENRHRRHRLKISAKRRKLPITDTTIDLPKLQSFNRKRKLNDDDSGEEEKEEEINHSQRKQIKLM